MKQFGSIVFLIFPLFCGAFPQNGVSDLGIECYKCNSKNTPGCDIHPTVNSTKEYCKDPKDECVSTMFNGVTYRGCKKDMILILKEPFTQICNSNLCNADILKVSPYYTPCRGPYCNTRKLQCYKCDSKTLPECDVNPSVNLPTTYCDPYDQCFNAIHNDVTYRGCQKELEKFNGLYMAEYCGRNLCNLQIYPNSRLRCYQCKGKECVKDFKQFLRPCPSYKETLCVTDVRSESDVVRTCALASDYEKSAFTAYCGLSGCNSQPTTYSGKCISCSSTNDTNCIRSTLPVPPGYSCTIPENAPCTATALFNRPISCFIYKKDNKVLRGCTQDAGKIAEDRDNFFECKGSLCNKYCLSEVSPKANDYKQRKCYKCDSKNLSECATHPFDSLPSDYCKDPYDMCKTAIVDGVTYRGCEAEMKVPTIADQVTCDKDLCNSGIFPHNRLQCYQCTGDCGKIPESFHSTPCVIYNKNDSCVTDVRNETNVLRKCLSDPDYKPYPQAQMCKGSGCNNQTATYTAECVSCNKDNCVTTNSSVAPGEKCTLPKGETCKETLLFNQKISCYTFEHRQKVVRGCAKDAGGIANDLRFRTCEGSMCNNECLPLTCIVCDSRKQPLCVNQAEEFFTSACPNNNTACFAGKTSEGVVIRGCGAKSTEVIEGTSCHTHGCNNQPVPDLPATVPSNRTLQCYKCESKNIPECATTPSSGLPHQQCEDSKDQCVTAVDKGITYRGCDKEVKTSDDAISVTCNVNLCNIEIFKIPSSKSVCQGKDCNTNSTNIIYTGNNMNSNNNNSNSNNNNTNNNNNNNNVNSNNNSNNIFIQIVNYYFNKTNDSVIGMTKNFTIH